MMSVRPSKRPQEYPSIPCCKIKPNKNTTDLNILFDLLHERSQSMVQKCKFFQSTQTVLCKIVLKYLNYVRLSSKANLIIIP